VRTVASLLIGSLLVFAWHAQAHRVVWTENPDGANPPIEPMELVYSDKLIRFFGVLPDDGEHCIVEVNLDPPPLFGLVQGKVFNFTGNPGVIWYLQVQILRAPISNFESATITGEWHATGQPPNEGCNAPKTSFAVPVNVFDNPTFGQLPNVITIGDPVWTWAGEVAASAVDLWLGGPSPLHFTRSYGSQLIASGVNSALGSNWMHNFDSSLSIFGDIATVTLYPGKSVQFKNSGSAWQPA